MLIPLYRIWHDQVIAKRYMDINYKNELQKHQGIVSRCMQKVNCFDKKVLGEHSTQYKHCYRWYTYMQY